MADLNKKERVKPFSFYCQQWVDVIMPTECREATQVGYRSIYNKWLKTADFFDAPVSQITESDVEKFLISCRKVLSVSTVRRIRNALSGSFKRAMKDRTIRINPSSGAKVSKGTDSKAKPKPYSHGEIDLLLGAFKDNKHYPLVLFLAMTGCRSGEAAGLKWTDINLQNRKALIRRTIARGKVVGTTKNGKERSVDLTRELVSVLAESKLRSTSKTGWVFQNTTGGFLNMDRFRERTWHPTLETAGLRRTNLHGLRHSYASRLINITKDIFYTSRQLGHASIKITADTYGHLLDTDSENRIVDALNRTLAAPCKIKTG
jgi:integrase